MKPIFERIRERKLFQWAIAYVAGGWLLLELLGFVADNFGWPGLIVRGATVLLGVGFFVTLVLAWYHGEKGQQRVGGVELLMLAALLLIAGVAVRLVTESDDADDDSSETVLAPPLGAASVDEASIAILPFENQSADPENEYFSDGITDDIITQLAKIGELKVISKTSVMKYRDRGDKSLREIGEELSVAAILEGGVRRVGDRVRINAQLIDARTDRNIWAETYDQELTAANVFAIQTDIAKRIAAELQATLAPDVEELIEALPTESLKAYDLYARGRYLSKRSPTRQDRESAVDFFRQAIAADSTYALPYVDLAEAYLFLWGGGYLPAEEAIAKARAAVEKALELDDALAEAHAALGSVLAVELRFEKAEQEFRRALQLNQNSADVHRLYARLLLRLGRYDESIMEARRAVELDPLSVGTRVSLASRLFYARDYAGVIEQAQNVLELEPDDVGALFFLGGAYILSGQHEEGITALKRALELDPDSPQRVTGLAWAYARSGQREQARELLQRIEEQGPMLKELAIVYGELGEPDTAFEYLDRALAEDPGSLTYMRADPTADSLRSDSRFNEVMRKLGLE